MYGFGAEWKEIWLRLVFFTQGPPGVVVMSWSLSQTTWVWIPASLLISYVTLNNYLLSLWLSF